MPVREVSRQHIVVPSRHNKTQHPRAILQTSVCFEPKREDSKATLPKLRTPLRPRYDLLEKASSVGDSGSHSMKKNQEKCRERNRERRT